MFMFIFFSVIALIVLSGLFFFRKYFREQEQQSKAYLKAINRVKPKPKK